MNRKSSLILIVAIVVLTALFVLSNRSEERSVRRESVALLKDVDGEGVATLLLSKKGEKIEVKNENGQWVLPVRSGYAANMNRLKTFLLKLFDLSVSQKVTADAKNYDALGVADSADAKVTLLDKDGKELAGIIIGDARKKGKTPGMAQGQYIRRVGSPDVYLIGESIEFVATPIGWLETDLLNIPQSKVRSVVQESLEGETKHHTFELAAAVGSEIPKFELDLQPEGSEEIQQPTITSTAGGLENVQISDVFKKDALPENLKGKQFDEQTTYRLSTGAVYEVKSFEEGGKMYASISVRFDPNLAKQTEVATAALNEKRKAEYEKRKQEAEAAKKEEEKKAGEKEVVESAVKMPPPFEPQKPEVITDADAQKMNEKFASWLYELPSYQGEKYRRSREDMLKSRSSEDGKKAEE